MSKSKLMVVLTAFILPLIVTGCSKNVSNSTQDSTKSVKTQSTPIQDSTQQNPDESIVNSVKQNTDTSENSIENDLNSLDKQMDLDLNIDDILL